MSKRELGTVGANEGSRVPLSKKDTLPLAHSKIKIDSQIRCPRVILFLNLAQSNFDLYEHLFLDVVWLFFIFVIPRQGPSLQS